jgi:hypothetical protein
MNKRPFPWTGIVITMAIIGVLVLFRHPSPPLGENIKQELLFLLHSIKPEQSVYVVPEENQRTDWQNQCIYQWAIFPKRLSNSPDSDIIIGKWVPLRQLGNYYQPSASNPKFFVKKGKSLKKAEIKPASWQWVQDWLLCLLAMLPWVWVSGSVERKIGALLVSSVALYIVLSTFVIPLGMFGALWLFIGTVFFAGLHNSLSSNTFGHNWEGPWKQKVWDSLWHSLSFLALAVGVIFIISKLGYPWDEPTFSINHLAIFATKAQRLASGMDIIQPGDLVILQPTYPPGIPAMLASIYKANSNLFVTGEPRALWFVIWVGTILLVASTLKPLLPEKLRPWAAPLPLGLLPPAILYYSLSLYVEVFIGAFALLLLCYHRSSPFISGLMLLAMSMTKNEGILIGLCLWGALLLCRHPKDWPSWLVVGLALAPAAIWVIATKKAGLPSDFQTEIWVWPNMLKAMGNSTRLLLAQWYIGVAFALLAWKTIDRRTQGWLCSDRTAAAIGILTFAFAIHCVFVLSITNLPKSDLTLEWHLRALPRLWIIPLLGMWGILAQLKFPSQKDT